MEIDVDQLKPNLELLFKIDLIVWKLRNKILFHNYEYGLK